MTSEGNQHQKRTFKPLVIFHNSDDVNSRYINQNNDKHHQNLVEEHHRKTVKMMEYNSQLWESTGSSNKISNKSFMSEHMYSLAQTATHYHSTSKNIYLRSDDDNTHRSKREHTEPSYSPCQQEQTQPPNAPTKASHPEKTEEKPIIGTTFIAEPKFHLVYNPYLGKKRKRENLPKNVTEFLKDWLLIHKKHPYPTEQEKLKLAEETKLTVGQVSNWFINARRRILQPMLESESSFGPQETHQNMTYDFDEDNIINHDDGNLGGRDFDNNMTHNLMNYPYSQTNDTQSKGKEKEH